MPAMQFNEMDSDEKLRSSLEMIKQDQKAQRSSTVNLGADSKILS